jgi:polysaccharide biosynthesis/export protein
MTLPVICLVMALQTAGMTPSADPPASGAPYLLGAADVVVVNVLGQNTLSGRYQIGNDGAFEFPLIGRVEAGGKDTETLEREITERLAKGYLRKPQVSVAMAEYASQHVYVIGEVRVPGVVAVTGHITLLGAISRAGGLSETAGGELVLIRPAEGANALGPTLATEPNATVVFRANTRDLRTGSLARNDVLEPGDTVFVPRAQSFQVLGQVRTPGAFTFEPGMTVLRALSLAGGATELGASNRLRILRTVDGAQKEIRAKYQDRLEPGDTLFIPTRRW